MSLVSIISFHWNLLDVIAVLVVVTSVIAGMAAGFARSGIGLLCAILGVLCGFWFYPVTASMVRAIGVSNQMAANLIGFLIIFFPFMMAGALLGRTIKRLFQRTGLGWLDRFFGAIFGFVRGALVVVAFVAVILAFTSRPIPNWLVDSRVLPYAVSASDTLASVAPQELKTALQATLQEVRDLWTQSVNRNRERVERMKDNSLKKKKERER